MGIFSKRKKPDFLRDDTPGQIWTQGGVPLERVNYNTVLDYLVGLSDEDYTKVCSVAAIYRKADAEAYKALGVEHEPTTFINPPENTELIPAHVNHKQPKSFLDDDEDDADIADILDLSNLEDTKLPGKKADLKIPVKDKK